MERKILYTVISNEYNRKTCSPWSFYKFLNEIAVVKLALYNISVLLRETTLNVSLIYCLIFYEVIEDERTTVNLVLT